MLGMEQGRAFVHHERRVRLEMPPGLEPPDAVWHHGARTTPVWEAGVLTEPKYFSFFLDASLPCYNPNHRSKWRSHELLHGATGFFWSPTQTPFEAYLGARLCELLPVVHWYGFDEVGRPRCPAHNGKETPIPKHTCPACEAGWTLFPEDKERSRHHLAQGLGHLAAEWLAVTQELHTGRMHERATSAMLNASQDALGYMQSHWPRTTAWSFGGWAEMFLRPSLDVHASVWGLWERVAQVSDRLLSGVISFDAHAYTLRRRRRVLQDLGSRIWLAMERLDPHSRRGLEAQDLLIAALEPLASRVQGGDAALEDHHEITAHVGALREAYTHIAGRITGLPQPSRAFGVGHDWLEVGVSVAELDQVAQGLEPWEAQAHAPALVSHTTCFEAPGLLIQRLATHLEATGHEDAPWFALQAWANQAPHQDEEAQWFGSLPQSLDDISPGDTVRLNHTVRRHLARAEDAARFLGFESAAPGPVALCGVFVHGELQVIQEDVEVRAALGAVGAGEEKWRAHGEMVLELMRLGVVVWLPGVAGGEGFGHKDRS